MKKMNLMALLFLFVGLNAMASAQQYGQARREDRELVQRELRNQIYNDERRDYDVQIETAETAYSNRDQNSIRGRARIRSGGANWQYAWYEGVIDTRRNRVINLRWGYDDNRGGQRDRYDDRAGQRDRYDDRNNQSGVLRPGRYELELVATRRMLSVGNDGRTVVQASRGGRSSQWDIEDAGNGYYYVIAAGSGDAMTVSGRGDNGDNIVLARLRRGDQSQLWLIKPGPDNGYYFHTARNKSIDSPSSARYDGGRMQVYSINGEANQRFQLRYIGDNDRFRDQDRFDRNRSDQGRSGRGRDSGFGGSGSVTWRGRVDDVLLLEIRDRSVYDRVVSGQRATGVRFTFTSALPRSEVNVSVDKRRGRGDVRVVEQPNRRNNYTAVIEIRDSSGGSSDYEIEVSWN